MSAKKCPQLHTTGRVAGELRIPLHRVQHILRTRPHIEPTARAGTLRLFNAEAIAKIRYESNLIDAKRSGKGAADE